jgi:regulator of protease activity HflC (stomatin/prohibitin superfamily)
MAYRAVMKTTVNRTLSEVLSQNVTAVTSQMRTMIQQDADALGLGVEIVAFNIGGMHPPVPVAQAYQAVVSAQIGRITAVTTAHAFRNLVLPMAQRDVAEAQSDALAQASDLVGKARGEAASFGGLDEAFTEDPQAFVFRSRLETLESVLPERPYTLLDSRIERSGGELWLMR